MDKAKVKAIIEEMDEAALQAEDSSEMYEIVQGLSFTAKKLMEEVEKLEELNKELKSYLKSEFKL